MHFYLPSIHSLSSPHKRIQARGPSLCLKELYALSTLSVAKNLLVIVPSHKDISSWLQFCEHNFSNHDLDTQTKASTLPHISTWGTDRHIQNKIFQRQRLFALSLLADHSHSSVIVGTLSGFLQNTLSRAEMNTEEIHLSTKLTLDPDDLMRRLENLGYIQSVSTDEEGFFSVRGSIFDVFALNHELPIRIEFVEDTIESLRFFDPADQKSKKKIEACVITPAQEAILPRTSFGKIAQKIYDDLLEKDIPAADREGFTSTLLNGYKPKGFELFYPLFRENKTCGLDLCNEQTTILFPFGIDACLKSYKSFLDELDSAYENDVEERKITFPPIEHFVAANQATAKLESFPGQLIEFSNPIERPGFDLKEILPNSDRLQSLNLPETPKEKMSLAFEFWSEWFASENNQCRVLILCHQKEQFERIAQLLAGRKIISKSDPERFNRIFQETEATHSKEILLTLGDLDEVCFLEDQNTLIIPQHKLLGAQQKQTKRASKRLQNYLNSFKDLKSGDLIVHTMHGIGRYKGMQNMTVAGITTDFLVLEYAGNDKIYLPVDRLSLLQRYASENPSAQVDRLGSGQWEKKKDRVKKSILDMADKLIKLQAQREVGSHHAYSAPSESYFKFEEDFPYDETDDQLKAIHEVSADLSSGRAMDRLVCGDVGFGKTEVALRAAMRVISDGKQVMVLVPTTVLCYQHFRTFSSRLTKFGFTVGQINRFIDAKTVQSNLEGFARGNIDVLIGTHRILTDKLKPKQLGLLVIDEEQKFGVIHKERLKEFRANSDILTLTATPIPRTLHMSMLGLKDISIIATPPEDRLSVRTYIANIDESLVKDAIERELKRGGQVFYVYNRVQDIEETLAWLKSLVPSATIRVGHGQMRDQDLEDVMIDFIDQKFQILLCTTIIESGIDIPNVNTLIVHDADHFGLSQLYQIRGRVGRSTQQGYAYFLVRNQEQMTEEARQRLEVLTTHQELGSGFQIASYDLEIRGAGNLLGAEQSGQVAEVGIELYTQMLEQAVMELRGQKVEQKIDTEFKVPVSAMIPTDYISIENTRLQSYKNIFNAESEDDLIELRREMVDRFGALPKACEVLFAVALLKQIFSQLNAISVAASPSSKFYEVKLQKLNESQVDKLIQATTKDPATYRLTPDYKLFVYSDTRFQTLDDQLSSLDRLTTLVRPFVQS